ncbi:hypothetical protein [Priestia flexa]|uniref:hypothetical protein n=1 Tax=Priestia flexa TaxID=86664 RepID=UPI003CFEDFB9
MMIYYIETKETKMLLANVDSFKIDEFHAKALDKKGRELFVCSKELLKVAHVVKDEKTFSSSNWGKRIINANTVWDD